MSKKLSKTSTEEKRTDLDELSDYLWAASAKTSSDFFDEMKKTV